MSKTDKYLVLACDPEEGQWSIICQTENADIAVDVLSDDLKDDPSLRIAIFTGNYITFNTEEEAKE